MSFLINPYRFAAAAGGTLLADLYPPTFAVSLQRLRTAQTNAIRIRETGGNTESNIGFSTNAFDASAATTFTGANNGEVVTWYDQSGNGYDVTQSTTTQQPQLISGGVINTDGTDYGVKFERSNSDVLTRAVYSTSKVFTLFVVTKLVTATDNNVMFLNGTANGYGLYTSGGVWKVFSRGVGDNGGGAYSTSTVLLTICRKSDTDLTIRINGTGAYSGTASAMNTPSGLFRLGGGDFGDFYGGHILEYVLYGSDQSANYTAIEADIKGRYANI